jgi:1-deoxy-D-xylulose-5-phosphate synthase
MNLLDTIGGPADLRRLSTGALRQAAAEVRELLVDTVCRSGGHLGPNLGVVELTLALHRAFDSPQTPIVFDTGHQAYVHKLLTGRRAGFAGLRRAAGLSGYPNRAESVHDVVENSHASTALAYADGLAKAFTLAGQPDRQVVAVVGDGALTGGLAWEALNNLGRSARRVVVVLNDNGRSYSPTVGGLPTHLARLEDRRRYAAVQELLGGGAVPAPGRPGSSAEGVFAELGFGYLGPVDGHDLEALDEVLRAARDWPGPVVVHCLTQKGRGYPPAERDATDRFHTVGVLDPETGTPATPPAPTWTEVFSDCLVRLGAAEPRLVAVSAAMLGPTGLQRFADRFPARCFDVGIAEQHALTSAAALAMGGLHPVVAVYATFANRAFDQALLDVGLHRQPVTLVLDRAGITGPDGPSHHGMWDLAMLAMVPGIRIAAPRDAATLAVELAEAVRVADGPTVLRFPKSSLGAPVPAVRRRGDVDLLRVHDDAEILLVAVGALAEPVLEAAETLSGLGVECTVADPRWVHPPSRDLVELAAGHRLVVTVEDGLREGGAGSRLTLALAEAAPEVRVHNLGLPTEFLPHGRRADLLAEHGLDAHGVATYVKELCGQLSTSRRRLRLVRGRGGAW